jgi:hypothetical protein
MKKAAVKRYGRYRMLILQRRFQIASPIDLDRLSAFFLAPEGDTE